MSPPIRSFVWHFFAVLQEIHHNDDLGSCDQMVNGLYVRIQQRLALQEWYYNSPLRMNYNIESHQKADQEKRRVALTSVVAAIFLTSMKLVVGLLTGSLGILAEATHSGLDLVTAGVTYFAVRLSGKPADSQHTYGHGKIENLSALFETVLLLVTCVWIIYEAIQRLFFTSVEVKASVWAFLVMGISIAVDFGRSRALARAARKYDSQALEADALHFSTDIWSSSVVIGGLFLVLLSEWLGLEWLMKADAVAALGVAAIVVYISLQLGKRTIEGLLDTAPAGLREELMKAVRVEGVRETKQVRVRKSGAESFVDVILVVNGDTSFERAHDIATQAEEAVRRIIPGADVLVYLEPNRLDSEGLSTTIRRLAARHELSVHGIRVYDHLDSNTLELHLEVSDSLRLDQAHAQASAFEEALRQSLPQIDNVVTHIEPTGDAVIRRSATQEDENRIRQELQNLSKELGVECSPHEINLQRTGSELSLSFHCLLDEGTPITGAHALTEEIERRLRAQVPSLGRVIIHTEPESPKGG